MMSNKQLYTPFSSSSTRLDQPEHQLQQYTAAMISARDRDRGRLSPEPHIEIMRPVSPFQSKRQFAHQQGQAQPTPPAQAQPQPQGQQGQHSYARILNQQYQATSSSSQPYAHAKHARAQEANGPSIHSNSHSNSHPYTTSSSRPRPRGYKEDQRGARSQQRDADISPALKMMSYDHSPTPPSSNDGHGRAGDPNASDYARSTSPEGHKRKNPSWRKPAPKYIPTPPSTPPTTIYERLPSTRGREEPVPPVPPPSSSTYASPSANSVTYVHRVPVKAHSEPAASVSASQQPPPRPARAATDHQVPVMFRDLNANLEQSRARVPTPQQATQSHTLPKFMNALSGPLKATTAQANAPSHLRTQNSAVNQTQTPTAPPTSPQPHATLQVHPPPTLAAGRSTSTRTADARSEQQPQQPRSGTLVHPQPKKVPSMAQLVAMVLPSRTPSPAPPPSTLEISGPMPLITPAVAVQSQSATLAPQATVPARSASTGLAPPAPNTETIPTSAVARSVPPPCQVLLPPSGDSSAKSSRSVSPQPSPPKVVAPLPVRSRSPTPAIIPQYAPPPPPFPPPPPNTPTLAPNQRISALLKQQTPSKLAEKVNQEVESEVKEKPAPVREQSQAPPSREQRMSAPLQQQQVSSRLAEKVETVADVQVAQVVEAKQRPTTMHERPTPSRESGLVTPPTTPPGTTATVVAMNEDHREVPSERPAAPITRSRSPLPASSAPVAPAKSAARHEVLTQPEQPRQTEEHLAKEVNEATRKVSPGSMHSTSINLQAQDTTTPPLPADWKETITRAVRSVSPSPPVPSQPHTELEETLSIRHFNKPTNHAQEKKDDPVPSYAFTETWTDKAEHATTALELHVHEVEVRRVNTPEVSEDAHLDGEREYRHQASRPARRTPVVIEATSAAAPIVEYQHRTALDLAPVDVPVRSRSPVPRRKAPQQFNATASLKQETIESRAAAAIPSGAEASSGPITLEPPPTAPVSHPPEYTSHNHSSGQKRKGKLTRKRTEDDDARAVPMDEVPPDIPNYTHYADTLVEKEPVSETTVRPASPPPRYQTLSTRKRLPRDGSDNGHAESGEKETLQERPSSPPVPVRPLSPPPLPQTPPKQSRTVAHGQHKRLLAPEVTQQAYRPPTPPIPSHYRKKRSNDMLPSDAFASFMKPPVHVIYPDTSASHGQSLSGDSGLNMPNSRTINYNNHSQPAEASSSLPYREEYERAQSPYLSTSASLDKDEDEDVGVETYPQVPPKARRTEVNARGPPTVSDRQSDYDFTVQQATRGQLRYPSVPMGQSKAHTLTLPPSTNSSRSRTVDASERPQNANMHARRTQQPHAKKAARSQSEKVSRNNNVQPVARSRSTPLPASSHRQRRGFWQAFGLWAKVFVSKFKTWATPAPSSSSSAGHSRYYDVEY